MNWMVSGVIALLVVATMAAWALRRRRRMRRHHAALRHLLEHADRLEAGLRESRQRLDRAHAMMAAAPGTPMRGEHDARQAVEAGLRLLLEHRLWIRDYAPDASQAELDEAVQALASARARLEPQLRALDHAQRDLEQAVREHLGQKNPT